MSYTGMLTDTCQVVRRTRGAFDPGTGTYGAGTDTVVYDGECRISPMSGMGARLVVGDEAIINRLMWIFLPLDGTGVQSEDAVKVTESEDANLVGAELVVREAAAEFSPNSSAGARWLIAEQVQEGE